MNGRRISEPHVLRSTDKIYIGDFVLVPEDSEIHVTAQRGSGDAAQPERPVQFEDPLSDLAKRRPRAVQESTPEPLEFPEPPVIVDPCGVVAVLVGGEPAADGFRGDLAGPLPVGAVQAGRVGVAAAVGPAAAGVPLGDRAGQHHAGGGDGSELGGDLAGLGLVAGGDTHGLRVA